MKPQNQNFASPIDHEYYFELCALATSGILSDAEWDELRQHINVCAGCKAEIQKYREIARTGVAMLLSERNIDEEGPEIKSWTPELAKQNLFGSIARDKDAGQNRRLAELQSELWFTRLFRSIVASFQRPGYVYVGASVLLALVLYRVGLERGWQHANVELASARSDRNALQIQIDGLRKEASAENADLSVRSQQLRSTAEEVQRRAAEIGKWKALQAQVNAELQVKVGSVATLQSELNSALKTRDEIAGKLASSEAAFREIQQRYDALQHEHAQELLHVASLEGRVADLSDRVKDSESEVKRHQQFLADDRDIRELMGARDLYIADVYDVDQKGQRRQPFGRVFYTKGKSLIFYAFDLDQQPKVQDASVFQLWGRRGLSDNRPLNMGIFYLDNEAHKRWVLRFDDPKALDQIDAVFVTVESHRGSQKPSGKQLLFASLRNQTNHP